MARSCAPAGPPHQLHGTARAIVHTHAPVSVTLPVLGPLRRLPPPSRARVLSDAPPRTPSHPCRIPGVPPFRSRSAVRALSSGGKRDEGMRACAETPRNEAAAMWVRGRRSPGRGARRMWWTRRRRQRRRRRRKDLAGTCWANARSWCNASIYNPGTPLRDGG